jgi:hypothetical protein
MPAPTLNVVIETPESDQGETAEKPIPAPKAKSIRVRAAAATAPAATAAHETADMCVSSARALGIVRDTVSMGSLQVTAWRAVLKFDDIETRKLR